MVKRKEKRDLWMWVLAAVVGAAIIIAIAAAGCQTVKGVAGDTAWDDGSVYIRYASQIDGVCD